MPQENLWDETLQPAQSRPVGLDLAIAEQELRIEWADGVRSVYTMRFLRQNCPCATCRTEREKQSESQSLLPVLSAAQAAASGATCVGGHLVGNYALQLDWSDGHSTGIYDFRLLRGWHTRP
jgi:DUF971 family protein